MEREFCSAHAKDGMVHKHKECGHTRELQQVSVVRSSGDHEAMRVLQGTRHGRHAEREKRGMGLKVASVVWVHRRPNGPRG